MFNSNLHHHHTPKGYYWSQVSSAYWLVQIFQPRCGLEGVVVRSLHGFPSKKANNDLQNQIVESSQRRKINTQRIVSLVSGNSVIAFGQLHLRMGAIALILGLSQSRVPGGRISSLSGPPSLKPSSRHRSPLPTSSFLPDV